MKRYLSALALLVVTLGLGAAIRNYYRSERLNRFADEPLWAYGFDTPPARGDTALPQPPPTRALRAGEDSAEQTRLRRIEGSRASYSLVDIRDGHNVIDWFPEDHPPMPAVVAHGPVALGQRGLGCAYCHLPNGKGRPENASLAALPVSYFMRQIRDFQSGRRKSADPRKSNTNTMIALAKALTEDELKAAAEYFRSLKWTPRVRVIETDSVPRTRIEGNLHLPLSRGRTEPIDGRIIEVPADLEQSERYRNPRSGFVAYVPRGSIETGKALVLTGAAAVGPKTTPCGTCHGPELIGLRDAPPIAGRSPSYIVRQLWDIQQGTRNGAAVLPMRSVVASLTPQDLVAVAAYVSSRVPPEERP